MPVKLAFYNREGGPCWGLIDDAWNLSDVRDPFEFPLHDDPEGLAVLGSQPSKVRVSDLVLRAPSGQDNQVLAPSEGPYAFTAGPHYAAVRGRPSLLIDLGEDADAPLALAAVIGTSRLGREHARPFVLGYTLARQTWIKPGHGLFGQPNRMLRLGPWIVDLDTLGSMAPPKPARTAREGGTNLIRHLSEAHRLKAGDIVIGTRAVPRSALALWRLPPNRTILPQD